MNELLKKIREDRCKTKKEISEGIISQKTYSNIEKGITSLDLNDLTKILKNLDVTFEEFAYQHKEMYEDYFSKYIHMIRKTVYSCNDKSINDSIDTILKDSNLNIRKKKILTSTLNCIFNISKGELKSARVHANIVWSYLKEFDTLYAYDLFLLTHIFIIFTDESLNHVISRIKKDIRKWRDFKNFQIVEMSFYLNYGKYLELQGQKIEAVNAYNEGLKLSKINNNALYALVCMVRLGRLTQNQKLVEQGIYILKIFNPNLCKEVLKEE
ncbi:TPA: helix-turn-helix transcriptional regulator [Staphylococcus aureus]|nr:helix-turn-helix transcriptional regulator [Staphylococcus aureus]